MYCLWWCICVKAHIKNRSSSFISCHADADSVGRHFKLRPLERTTHTDKWNRQNQRATRRATYRLEVSQVTEEAEWGHRHQERHSRRWKQRKRKKAREKRQKRRLMITGSKRNKRKTLTSPRRNQKYAAPVLCLQNQILLFIFCLF